MDVLHRIMVRLKKPSVFVSIVSEIIAIMLIFNVKVDVGVAEGLLAAVSSIFVTLGILSNPMKLGKGYQDDMRICENCGKMKRHVLVGGQLLCEDCGTKFVEISIADFEKIQNGEVDITDLAPEQSETVVENENYDENDEENDEEKVGINDDEKAVGTMNDVTEVLEKMNNIVEQLSNKQSEKSTTFAQKAKK